MKTKIRNLDFDAIVAQVEAATDRVRRTCCHSILQANLSFVENHADAVDLLRDQVMLAAVRHAQSLEDIDVDHPLVQALIRVQHHPLARPFGTIKVREGLRGPDAGPRLRDIISRHPELTWDADAVQSLIIRSIRDEDSDHELDAALPPWDMYWSPASAAALALFELVTLRTLGDLELPK